MTAARNDSEASAETPRARSGQVNMAATKPGRRHLRLTITEDMQDLWAWFQDVRPRAAAREVEFLLRLGVLHATGPWTSGASQLGPGAYRAPALPASAPAPSAASQLRNDTQLEPSPAAEDREDSG